ncbi:hypothetical protein CVT24_007596 [Panaeolus cyanescens]|uniref:Ubiquitin carboxyl-terminal hydrolase n=1 Tax=Panaeolus cyanescens TaxID=181874 RepID=A0A409YKK0_9AGAR|nr:hypothetical protein CVT24_007596 [Panaeolus cyanescens]
MSCVHYGTLLTRLEPPRLSQSVHREECTQCFDNQNLEQGIDVCLSCFNGGCVNAERHHASTHAAKSGHKLSLNIRRIAKEKAPSPSGRERDEDGEPPAKMTKLAIAEEPKEEEKYDFVTRLRCWTCDSTEGKIIEEAEANPKYQSLKTGVLQSLSSARQSEVKAWEEEITPCEHTLMLEQLVDGTHIAPSGLAHCNSCDLTSNLWLCLTCGSLGCGRQQFGGVSGNGHGLSHFEQSGHPVSVKLGTITPEGGADVYCYACNDAKEDPDLKRHLASFGINVQSLSKTEKSMTELQIEQNLNYDFSLTGDDGKALQPLFGPNLTGLSNLGNSCYMASVLQTLFALPSFQNRYGPDQTHAETCTVPLPADCVECQLRKVGDGLLSGRYSHPRKDGTSHIDFFMPSKRKLTVHVAASQEKDKEDEPSVVFGEGVKPMTFKALVGKGHAEFSTMRQQDAEEFFGHLLETIRRDGVKFTDRLAGDKDATKVFSYATEQRLQCQQCHGVRYRTDTMDVVSVSVPATELPKSADEPEKRRYADVALTACIEGLQVPEVLDGYSCPGCKMGVAAVKQTKFATLPEVFVVHAKKFQLVNWVPTKLDIPIILPENDQLVFTEAQIAKGGLQPGEVALPEGDAAQGPAQHQFNESALEALQAMGFPLVRCQKALLATGNGSDAEAAMEWLFGHMEDPDIDDPIPPPGGAGASSANEPSADQIAMLADMGFTSAQAKKALQETGGNAERAVEWLFNHPDDTGDEAPTTTTSSSSSSDTLPGSKSTPARYQLKGFISHKGPSVHSGHYVAHIRQRESGEWVLFNDEKVVRADVESVRELKKFAYLYFFERV